MPLPVSDFEESLSQVAQNHVEWDLKAVSRIDSVGALILWRAWGRQWPVSVDALPHHRSVLERVERNPEDVVHGPMLPQYFGFLTLGA